MTAGQACWNRTKTISINAAGAAQATTAVKSRKRSGGAGGAWLLTTIVGSVAVAKGLAGGDFDRALAVEPVADSAHGDDVEWQAAGDILAGPSPLADVRLRIP